MRKIVLVLCFALGVIQFSQAQLDFGVKAGINFNSDSFQFSDNNIKEVVDTKSKMGYHVGIWTRIKVPVIGLYIRPELVYTALRSEITNKTLGSTDYNFQKIDIPVLIGKKFLGVANVFVGPSFQYIIDGDLKWDVVKEVKSDGFTVGMQLGAGVELGKIGLDVRWERGFSDTESKAILKAGGEGKFDTRVNQIIVGLSYKF